MKLNGHFFQQTLLCRISQILSVPAKENNSVVHNLMGLGDGGDGQEL